MTSKEYIEKNMDLIDSHSITPRSVEVFLHNCPQDILPDVLNILASVEIYILTWLPHRDQKDWIRFIRLLEEKDLGS